MELDGTSDGINSVPQSSWIRRLGLMTRSASVAPSVRALAVLALFLSVALPGLAQAPSDDFEVVVAPYFMLGNLTGEAAVGRSGTVPVDLRFGDILKKFEMGVMAHGEVWKGGWGFMADHVYMRLGADLTGPLGGVVDVEVEESFTEAFLAHRFRRPGGQVDVFAGIRYWNLDLDVELTAVSTALDRGDDWVDPVIGGRIVQDLNLDWFFTARGDIGGFGANSDFSWNLQGGLGYKVSERFSVVVQYKALGVDYENEESGRDFLSYDTTMYGPLVGFVFRF